MCRGERQWRDLSLCLNLLTYSERTITKLYENMPAFANKLSCDIVHEHIASIITSARKLPNLKLETKQMLDEFEQKVEECRTKGVEGNVDESEVQKIATPTVKPAPAKPAAKSKPKPPPKRTRNRRGDSDDDEPQPSPPKATPKATPMSTRPRREAAKRPRRFVAEESDDE